MKALAFSSFILLSIVSLSQPLIQFTFQAAESKVLNGKSTEPGVKYGCGKGVLEADIIGAIALVSELYQNGCYTDGRYNHSDFKVEKGVVKGSDNSSYEAYRLYEPSKKASQFLGSQHRLHIRFPKRDNYSIYSFADGVFKKMGDIPSNKVKVNDFTKIESISASTISGELTVLFIPTKARLSVYHQISPGVEAGVVFQSGEVKVDKTRYSIKGEIFDTPTGFPYGPETHANVYGQGRKFFHYPKGDNQLEVIWQNNSDKSINLSTVNVETRSINTQKLPTSNGRLAAVARDNEFDKVFYLTITENKSPTVTLNAAKPNGQRISSKRLGTSKSDLNIWIFDGDEVATLAYSNGILGMIISRTMNKSSDGLNHQGAIGLTIDARTLEVIENFGQTSGHSFDNILYPAEGEGFYGFDLGDNYPRGINLHQMTQNDIASKVIYTFKTAHGSRAKSPANRSYPLYAEISSSQQRFFKWSNDNKTYTELGGMVDNGDSFGVFFIGEPDDKGNAINNSRAKGYVTDSRNIGFVKTRKDWRVTEETVLSSGVAESGGFYDFGGRWSKQSNKGIKWLTDYKDVNTQNVSRLKVAAMKDGTAYLFWELWTKKSYVSTYMMKVDADGKVLTEAIDIGSQLRLNRRDEPVVMNGSAYFIAGVKTEGVLEVIEVGLN